MFKYGIIVTIIIFEFLIGANVSLAQTIENSFYTNVDFFDVKHDTPANFTQDSAGNFSGITADGKLFYQKIITNSISIRLQRFSIDEAFFYISDQGIIVADNDTVALSIYLTRVG